MLWAATVVRAQEPPQTGPQTETRFPPLKVPAGFKATLFACDPLIEYPSAIAAGSRPGAVFVAIDYMTGLGTEIVRRSEVRLVEDANGDGYADKATVLADGFNSIQGLTWHDGTVYAMHAPYLTSLRDNDGDGKADERKDLVTGLGLTPEENPVRLHCANGLVMGHDGWLYLALGDHGCDVQRPEGDRLVLHGGGILRCRPDGRDLHIFSTGLRNIYDVALDEELNVFVRDNENDGGTYKIRVCHSFHGADHGYPYLYEERPDEAQLPLADLALGSSAGGASYLERQFPSEYHGNLFFCEWGRSIVRYQPRRAGSAFGPVEEIEFAAGAPGDTYGFKPTDVVVQRDGTLMISDYADGQRPKRGRGRIYHIAYVGTEAKSLQEDLLTRLDSASYAERCDAQAAIERQGLTGLKTAREALMGQRLGMRGRLHAIWIVARGNRIAAIDELLALAQSDPEPSVRAQAIRAIADLADPVLSQHRLDAGKGDKELAERLAELAKNQDRRVLLEVIVALGRLRWPGLADWLKESLENPDATLTHAAMQAMRRSENWPAILQLLDAPENDPLRPIALRALAERVEPTVVDGIIERLRKASDPNRRRQYAYLLARVYHKPGPWIYWGYKPAPRPANTEAWERTSAIAAALDGVLADPDRTLRLDVLRRMQREKVPARDLTLGRWLKEERDAGAVAAILPSLATASSTAAKHYLRAVVLNAEHTTANRLTALAQFAEALDAVESASLLDLAHELDDGPVLAEALRQLGKSPSLKATSLFSSKLSSPEPEVRAAAIETMGKLGRAASRESLATLLQDQNLEVRRAAVTATGKLGAKELVEPLLKLAASGDAAVRRASFDSLRMLKAEGGVPLAVAALKDSQVDLSALEYLAELGGPQHAGAIADLAKRNPSARILDAAIRCLTNWDVHHSVAELQGASGTILRWQINGPVQKEHLPASDFTSGHVAFATATEARLSLAKDAAKDSLWAAHAEVAVTESAEVEFLGASSGTLQVWLNDRSVFDRQDSREFRADSDRFAATLAAGTNQLVAAVKSAGANVELQLRFRRKSATAAHERLIRAALARSGNAQRGQKVFLDVEKSLCLKCHRWEDQGERTGPELTGIGSRFSRIHIVESILEPSRAIAPSFGAIAVQLSDGSTFTGVPVNETETTLTLADNQGQKQTLIKSNIDDQRPSPMSTMPDGLEKRLTDDEFVDLIGFLVNAKEPRAP